MTLPVSIFAKLMPAQQLFIQKSYTKFHANLINYSVTDVRSDGQMAEQINGEMDIISTQGILLFTP